MRRGRSIEPLGPAEGLPELASRLPDSLEHIAPNIFIHRGKPLRSFSGCDYFKLSWDRRIRESIQESVSKDGVTTSASRITSGNHGLYTDAEERLAKFFGFESAVIASSATLANVMVGQALASIKSELWLDEKAHSSLVLGSKLTHSSFIQRYDHLQLTADETFVRGRSSNPDGEGVVRVVMTDGLFAHSGVCAPLTDYVKSLRPTDLLWVDDAHGVGVLGKRGRGVIERLRAQIDRVLLVGSLGKAFGCYGGFIACSREFKARVLETSHAFGGNTPLPLPLVAAVLKSLEILESEGHTLRTRLRENMKQFYFCLDLTPTESGASSVPFIGLEPRSKKSSDLLNRRLLEEGIYPPFIRYPGGASSGFFRFVISSEHSAEDIEKLANVLKPSMESLELLG